MTWYSNLQTLFNEIQSCYDGAKEGTKNVNRFDIGYSKFLDNHSTYRKLNINYLMIT